MQPVEHVVDPEELNEYLDRELPASRAAEIDAHVTTCSSCQKVLADLRSVSRDLRAWRVEDAPPGLLAGNVVDRVPLRRPWSLSWMPSWVTVPVVGIGAVVLLVVAMVPKRTPSPAASSAPPVMAAARATEGAVRAGGSVGGQPGRVGGTAARGPRIMRTASLRLVAGDFDAARAAVDRIASEGGGYVGSLTVSGARPSPRTLAATVHVPVDRASAAIAALRALGEVVEESQASQDVSEQLIDLEARLANNRNTEERLKELLRSRTGRLSDVLEAEREITRVRQEIEVLEAQRKSIETRVIYAAITLQIAEEHKSSISLGPLPLSIRIRNALVDGFRTAFETAVTMLLLLLQLGPVLLFWGVLVGVPVRLFLRRRARASA